MSKTGKKPELLFCGASRAACYLIKSLGGEKSPFNISIWNRSKKEFPFDHFYEPEDLVELTSKADIIIISTADNAIKDVVAKIKAFSKPEAILGHLSGSIGLKPFDSNKISNGFILHPAFSIPAYDTIIKAPVFMFYGKRENRRLNLLLGSLKGSFLYPQTLNFNLYHASLTQLVAGLISNFEFAFQNLKSAGLSEKESMKMVLSLSNTVFDNCKGADFDSFLEKLSGPASRKDEGTIEKHILNLDSKSSALYRITYEFIKSQMREASFCKENKTSA